MKLSIIVPVFNERNFIVQCLESICNSRRCGSTEILVLDGGSTDGTLELLEEFASKWPEIKLVPNDKKFQVYALNLGILLAKGEYIIRCDAHSIYPSCYFFDLIGFLQNSDNSNVFGNVGLIYKTKNMAASGFEKGIAFGMGSKFGVGISHRSLKSIDQTREVDTLLFGAWKRSTFERVGLFDERFIRGQDYEHNLRIKKFGLRVALIPGEGFVYHTRSNLKKLSKMIYQYAYAKAPITLIHKRLPNFRSFVPAAFYLSIPAQYALGIASWGIGIYFAIAAIEAGRAAVLLRSPMAWVGAFLAFVVMHASHALGLLTGLFDFLTRRELHGNATNTR